MFHKSQHCSIKNEQVQLNHSDIHVPKISLVSQKYRISIYPYRMIFEPCTPSDDFCCLEVRLASLKQFLKTLKTKMTDRVSPNIESDIKCKWIFHIKEDKDSLIVHLNELENHIALQDDHSAKKLNERFNQLRQFVHIPSSKQLYKIKSDKDISDQEMANSVFARRYKK